MYLAHGIGRRLVETLDRTAHLKLRHHLARGDFVVLASDLKAAGAWRMKCERAAVGLI